MTRPASIVVEVDVQGTIIATREISARVGEAFFHALRSTGHRARVVGHDWNERPEWMRTWGPLVPIAAYDRIDREPAK